MPKKSSKKDNTKSDTEEEYDTDMTDMTDIENETLIDDVVENDNEEDDLEEINDENETNKERKDDDCLYNDLDDSDDGELDEEIVDDLSEKKQLIGDDRITKPILYYYERIRLLADRTKQLSLSAKPMVKHVRGLDPREVAELEIENGVCPLVIERELPNGYYEEWFINELER